MTVGMLKSSLTREEQYKWLSYYQYKRPDITEIQLATIAVMVSAGLGNKKAKIDDFIISKGHNKVEKTKVLSSDEVAGFFGGLM